MVQLPSFLPALFEAFGNQSADVRKVLMLLHALDNVSSVLGIREVERLVMK